MRLALCLLITMAVTGCYTYQPYTYETKTNYRWKEIHCDWCKGLV